QGTRVFIPKDFDGEPQRVVLEAVHRQPSAGVYWYVDDRYIGVTNGVHQMEALLEEGRHRLTLMDEEGNVLQQTFRVVGK
ncbi:MAG: penicillin-binding protein 1C, partial [Odoribacter sp.]|nr:penicillin-binding protein 1C [Odoribacter sp.]